MSFVLLVGCIEPPPSVERRAERDASSDVQTVPDALDAATVDAITIADVRDAFDASDAAVASDTLDEDTTLDSALDQGATDVDDGGTPCPNPLPEPLVLWTMDALVGDAIPNQGSVSGLDLIGPSAVITDGHFANVLSFDGTLNQKPTAAHVPELELDAGTISVWFRADPSVVVDGGRGGIVTKEASGVLADGHVSLEVRDARIRFRLERSTESVFLFAPIVGGQWHHGLATWQDGRSELWLDGELIDSADAGWSIATNPEPIAVGFSTGDSADGSVEPASEPFLGEIDEVAIWAQALPGDRIPAVVDCSPLLE